jgi:hypothetical protein
MTEQVWRDGKLVDGEQETTDTVAKIQHALDQAFNTKEGLVKLLVAQQARLNESTYRTPEQWDQALAILRERYHEQIARAQGVCDGLARALAIERGTTMVDEYNAACERYKIPLAI